MHAYQIIMLYTLNTHSCTCQSYLREAGKDEGGGKRCTFPNLIALNTWVALPVAGLCGGHALPCSSHCPAPTHSMTTAPGQAKCHLARVLGGQGAANAQTQRATGARASRKLGATPPTHTALPPAPGAGGLTTQTRPFASLHVLGDPQSGRC